jgi:Protein of unknown function (DUF1403)
LRAFDGPKAPRAPRLPPWPARESPGPHPRRSRGFQGGRACAPRRKPPKKWAFWLAPRWPRCIRSPATITRSAACGASAWRSEDEAALRDAFYLRQAGDDPGPAGRLLQAWRRLAERDPLDKAIRLVLRPKDWMVDVTNALDVPLDAGAGRRRRRRQDVGRREAVGEGSAIAAAAAVAAVSLQKRPDAEALALWLADAVLAHRLKWPAPVPLIAGQIRRSDLRGARDHDGRAWQATWVLAYARAAAAAADLYAELARRAHQLLAAAPQLRGATPRAESRCC